MESRTYVKSGWVLEIVKIHWKDRKQDHEQVRQQIRWMFFCLQYTQKQRFDYCLLNYLVY